MNFDNIPNELEFRIRLGSGAPLDIASGKSHNTCPMSQFDPNAPASDDSGIFGLPPTEPHTEEGASLVFLPVPWEATTSYGGGTSEGPGAIRRASHQVDLYDLDVLRPYEPGFFMLPESAQVRDWNQDAKNAAQRVIRHVQSNGNPAGELHSDLNIVNQLGERLNEYVYSETRRLISKKKIVGVVGGDHSVPFGALKAIAEKETSFGILHFDAHSDTRKAYEGFTWSHASIMYNVLEAIPQVARIVQVGIRDLCEAEYGVIQGMKERVKLFSDRDLKRRKFEGMPWARICEEIVESLPDQVWVSFDIDGLDPRFCPHTGTPVPGGLDFQEANYLLSALVASGKRVIGFDLNEVAPNLENPSDEWDANVGARLLYKLAGWTMLSQGKVKRHP